MLLEKKFLRLIMSILVCFGLVFTFFVPPFQKPDEVVHFLNAISINRNLDIKTGDTKILKRLDEYVAGNQTNRIAFSYSSKYPWKLALHKDPSNELIEYSPSLSLTNFISYLPASVGINLGAFSPYPAVSFYLGRLFNLLFFVVSLYFSLKILGKSRLVLYPYLLVPMLWFQVTSISYDVVPLGLGLLLFSYFLSLFMSKESDNRKFLIFTVLCFLFLISKSGYYPIILLPLLFILNKWKKLEKKKKILYLIYLFLLFTASFFSHRSNFLAAKNFVYSEYDAVAQLNLVKSNPLYLVDVFKSTLHADMADFWLKSFFGIFGWLDYSLNFVSYIVIALLLFYFIYKYIKSERVKNISWFSIIFLGLIIFGGIFLVIFSFYFIWSHVGSKMITGVQGRYFLVYFPFLIFWLKLLHDKIGNVKFKNLFLALGIGIIFYQIVSTTYYRYYDYSLSFGNDSLIEERIKSLKNPEEEELGGQKISLFVGDNKFSGLQFFMKGEEEEDEETNTKNIVYRFTVYDGGCDDKPKLLFSDYKNCEYLQGNKLIHFNKVINPKSDYVCVAIDKVDYENNSRKVFIVKSENEYLLYPLLISR